MCGVPINAVQLYYSQQTVWPNRALLRAVHRTASHPLYIPSYSPGALPS